MMRRLTSFITAFVLSFALVAVSGCGKRGELRLPYMQSHNEGPTALLAEVTHG